MDDESKILEKHGYILHRNLGKGSFGQVKSAYSKSLMRKVAIKIIDQSKAPDNIVEKFVPRELDILASLNHPNIIKTYKIFGKGESKLFIVMELCTQGDLLEFIKSRGKLREELSKKMFHQLALAIKYIHDQNIVHRDLKCENLLLDKDLNLKVADFGFSKRLEYMDGQMMLSNSFCGSTAYASPELLQKISYNPKVNDVWCMGVVLFIMLTGQKPYDDTCVKKMLGKQKDHDIAFPRSVQDKCKDACDLISRMLDPHPAQRIDINQILQHPWLQVRAKLPKRTPRPLAFFDPSKKWQRPKFTGH